MTTFKKAKLKKSDDQTNIEISCKYYKIYLPKKHHSKSHDDKAL